MKNTRENELILKGIMSEVGPEVTTVINRRVHTIKKLLEGENSTVKLAVLATLMVEIDLEKEESK